MTSTWTSGYVADIDYTAGFYEQLTPARLSFALLAKGYAAPDIRDRFTYCELGCGQGVTSALMAAAYPNGDFWATDFNPAHIARAGKLAAAAGLDNVHFLDSSFEEFCEADLPRFDFISLHGVWSWVGIDARRAIIRLIHKQLKVGGVVYVSYNALPGWAATLPLQRLLADHAASSAEPAEVRIRRSVEFADRLRQAGAGYFEANPVLASRLAAIKEGAPEYLAHEYLPQHFAPAYFADVQRDLSEAKLSYACAADVLDHVDSLHMSEQQRQLLAEIGAPVFRESVRDLMLNARFRRDIYIKGPTRLDAEEANERWRATHFALKVDRSEAPMKVNGLLGEAELNPEVYAPILDALARGPMTLAQLMSEPEIAALGFERVKQALCVLVGGRPVDPCPALSADAARAQRTRAFNIASLERARRSGETAWLASPVTGSGIAVDGALRFFLLGCLRGRQDLAEYAWELMSANGMRLVKDGKELESAEENLAELRIYVARFAGNPLPVFQKLGIA